MERRPPSHLGEGEDYFGGMRILFEYIKDLWKFTFVIITCYILPMLLIFVGIIYVISILKERF